MKIGICGGTFDPVHRGHLDPILAVRETAQWDRVLYIPAHMQPFKQHRETASAFHRFAMVALAILGHDTLFATPMELERGRVSFTVETLEELRARHPHDTLDWIIGDDNLAQLLEWKSIERIFELANFVVLTRVADRADGMNLAVPDALRSRVTAIEQRPAHGAISLAENATVPISSTAIREHVQNGQMIEHLVPPPVSRYIHHYRLYRKGQQ